MTSTPPMPISSSVVPKRSPIQWIDQSGKPARPTSATPMAISSKFTASFKHQTRPQPSFNPEYQLADAQPYPQAYQAHSCIVGACPCGRPWGGVVVSSLPDTFSKQR